MRTYKLGLLIALFCLVFGAVMVAAQDTTTEIELVGTVEAMSLDTITVNQLVIDVTRAEIKVALQLGVAVKVQGSVLADGSVVAREVKAPQDTQRGVLPGEMEITGLLTDFSGTSMTIAGQTVDVSGAEIKAGVTVGQLVKAHVTLAADGSWVAREVEPGFAQGAGDNANPNANTNANANDNLDDNGNANDNSSLLTGNEMEVVGTLTEAGSDFIVVGGQRISVAGAEIKSQLFLGALVKVHMSAGPNGLVAREVELERERANDNAADNSNDNTIDNSNDNVVVPDNCVPAQPAGWTTYTIRRGDTLAGIAQGSGSSLSELAAANCIRDARFIVAGATIFVPRTPVTSGNVNANQNGNDNGNDNGDDNHNGNDNGDDHSNDNGNNDNGDDDGGNSGSGGGNSGSGGGDDDGSGHG